MPRSASSRTKAGPGSSSQSASPKRNGTSRTESPRRCWANPDVDALHRRLDEFGVVVLAFFALSLITAAGFNSARLLLVKDSLLTGAFGVLLLSSLAFPKPLMFYFGRKFATDGTAAGVARWNGLWQYEGFRSAQRFLTVVWGTVFCAEAALRVILAYNLPTAVMVTVNAVLPLTVIGGLIAWTIAYGKRGQARAAAQVTQPDLPE